MVKYKHEGKLRFVHSSMIRRCYDRSDPAYKRYGGSGIGVSISWYQDFWRFYNWAMANGYKPGLEIDRIDNNKGYKAKNCRFVTRRENANNRECTLFVEYKGNKYPFAIAVEKFGCASIEATRRRLLLGWTVEGALSTPVSKKSKKNMKGQIFGKLLVIARRENYKWLCKCECGVKTAIRVYDLLDGKTKSCGCTRFVRGG